MENTRQPYGDETWFRLLAWTRDQKPAERLAALLLVDENYEDIDPSHPLGGPDGGKDILCKKDGITLIGAVYFANGQQSFSTIRTKFLKDLDGVSKNRAKGIVFVTNQKLTLGERDELRKLNRVWLASSANEAVSGKVGAADIAVSC